MSRWISAGAALMAGLAARPVLNLLLTAKFRGDVARLNNGDQSSLLAAFAEDAVLLFHDGPHRWAGPNRGRHVGRPAIAAFLHEYVTARVQGEIVDVWTSGPPWALTLVARFDDHAEDPDGERLYENQAVLVVKTRFGAIVEQQDFYIDTQRIVDFDRALSERGVTARG